MHATVHVASWKHAESLFFFILIYVTTPGIEYHITGFSNVGLRSFVYLLPQELLFFTTNHSSTI